VIWGVGGKNLIRHENRGTEKNKKAKIIAVFCVEVLSTFGNIDKE
jgi:hypothetical protein